MNFNIGVTISPELDARKLNEILTTLKSKLGALGADIELLSDEDIAHFDKLKQESDELAASFIRDVEAAKGIGVQLDNMEDKAKGISSIDMSKAFKFNQITQAVNQVSQALGDVISVGADFGANLDAVQAVTGANAETMDKLSESARGLALEFGGEATTQLKSFQGILSKLGPQVADSPASLAKLAQNVNILSAASGDDAQTSMNALVDTMLQMGLASDDAATNAENSTRVINALAKGAQVGAAEVPQVAEALLQTGVAAKGAGLSLEATNAAIQVLSLGGKTGSEAGIALRNVLGLLQNASGPAETAMKKLGTSSKELGELLTTKGLDAALAKVQTGMNGLGSVAEKNATLMEIFGTENAAAAGILLDQSDKLKSFENDIRAGTLGVGSAFEQAAIRMDNAQTLTAQATAFIKDQMIGLFNVMGDSFAGIAGATTQIAPMVTTFAGLKEVIPTETVAKFAGSIKDVVLPALVKLGIVKATGVAQTVAETAATAANTVAKGAQAVATTTATGAQYGLNTAMLANPIFLLIAGITAGVAAFALFSDSTKDLETAMTDANAALDDFNTKTAEAKTAKDQADAIKALASEYDSLKGKQDAASQTRFNELATQLASSVPESAEAIDLLSASGERVGTTYRVSTDIITEFANEQARMAEQARSDAMQTMVDEAASLVDSYRDATTNSSELRAEQKALTEEAKKNGDALKGTGNILDDLANPMRTVKDRQKEVNKELSTQSKQLQEARNSLQKLVNGFAAAGKSTKEIAQLTGLTEKEVKQLSASFGGAEKSAKGAAAATVEIKASADNATKSAKDLAAAYKAVKQAANDALDNSKGAFFALQQEQDSARKQLAETNKRLATETSATIRTELEKTKAFLETRLRDIPKQMDELRKQAREAVIKQKQFEKDEKLFDLSIGAIDFNVTDYRSQAQKVWAEIGQIDTEIANETIADAAARVRAEIKSKMDSDIAALTTQITELRKAAAKTRSTVGNQVLGDTSLEKALRAKMKAIERKAAADTANAEKKVQEERLKQIREALEKELEIRARQLDRVAEVFNRQAELITGESDEAIDARMAARLSALQFEQNATFERLLASNDKYVEAYGALQMELARADEELTAEQRAEHNARVIDLRKSLEATRSGVFDFLRLQDLQKRSAQELTDEQRAQLNAEIEAVKTRLATTNLLTAENQDQLLNAYTQFEDKKTDITRKADEERYKLAVDSINKDFEKRKSELEKFLSDQELRLQDTQAILDNFISDLVRGETAMRQQAIKQMFDNMLLSQEDFDRRRAEAEEEGNRRIEGMKEQSAGIQLEIERRKLVAELELQKQHFAALLKAAPAGSDDAKRAQEQLDETTAKIKEQGNTLTLVGREASDAFTNMALSAAAGQDEAVKDQFRKFLNVMLGALNALASVKITEVLLNMIGPAGIPGLIGAVALRPIVEKLVQGFLSIGISAIARFGTGGVIEPGKYTQPTAIVVGDMPVTPQKEWVFTDDDLRSVVQMANGEMANALAASIGTVVEAINKMPTRFVAHGRELRIATGRDQQANNRRRIIGRESNWGD